MSFYEYNGDYVPAMPVCEIYLGAVGQAPTLGPLEAILDTGSNATIVSTRYLLQVGATPVNRERARSVWGDARLVDIYAASLAINGLRLQSLREVADDWGDEIILGRFVLNRLKVVLDGPGAMVEIVAGERA